MSPQYCFVFFFSSLDFLYRVTPGLRKVISVRLWVLFRLVLITFFPQFGKTHCSCWTKYAIVNNLVGRKGQSQITAVYMQLCNQNALSSSKKIVSLFVQSQRNFFLRKRNTTINHKSYVHHSGQLLASFDTVQPGMCYSSCCS